MRIPSDVVPVHDLAPVAWLRAALTGSSGRVRDLLPTAYAAHVRVPGRDGDPASPPVELGLRDTLVPHTTTPHECWFTFWEGFEVPRSWDRAPRLLLPHREHLVFAGALAELEVVMAAFGEVGYDAPALWWPADRAWVAHWEVDSDAVYVACSRAALADLVVAGIGAHEVGLDDAITFDL